MKRTICLILFLLSAALLVCCGKNGENNDENENGEKLDYLALVNKENKLPDGWESSLKTVNIDVDADGDKYTVEVEKEAYGAYVKLKEALEKEGIFIDLDSSRRSVAEQERIVRDFTEKYGEDYVRQYVAVPGFSEHHTGLAIDIFLRIDGKAVNMNEDMVRYTPIWNKIHEKLPEYGFILRYLEGKEDITGYSYEPWHIRYVGSSDIAKEITSKGITLEEYLGRLPEGDVSPKKENDGTGQNPVMNYIGDYVADRAEIQVRAKDGDEAVIYVRWSSGYDTAQTWEMSGRFDADYLLISYKDALVSLVTYNEDGTVKSSETVASSVTGRVQFAEDGRLLWNDGVNTVRDMVFTFKPSENN